MKQTSKQKWFNTHVLFERPAVLLEIPSPTAKTKNQIIFGETLFPNLTPISFSFDYQGGRACAVTQRDVFRALYFLHIAK